MVASVAVVAQAGLCVCSQGFELAGQTGITGYCVKEAGKWPMPDKTLDAQGLNCPLPILKAKKALQELPIGGTLEVLATDPGSVADFTAFCRATGHRLLEQTGNAGVFRFLIERQTV